jgi:pilus assembly protein FimV
MERTMVEPGAEGGLDLDLGLAEAGAPETPPGAAQAAEIDFDFDLDLEEDEAKTLALGHAPAGDTDEVGTKLDLAQAYIDMGDVEGARGILTEVLAEGSEAQREEARLLMSRLQS